MRVLGLFKELSWELFSPVSSNASSLNRPKDLQPVFEPVCTDSTGSEFRTSWWYVSARASSVTATSTWDSTDGWSSLHSLTAYTSPSHRHSPWSSEVPRPAQPALERPRPPKTSPRYYTSTLLSVTGSSRSSSLVLPCVCVGDAPLWCY